MKHDMNKKKAFLTLPLVLVALAGGCAPASDNAETAPEPSTALAITQDAAPGAHSIEIVYDYACSHCAKLDKDWHEQLEAAAANGSAIVEYHPVAVMGTALGTYAAAAERTIHQTEPDLYVTYRTLAHQQLIDPLLEGEADTTEATPERFVEIAREAGASQPTLDALEAALADQDALEDMVMADYALFKANGWEGTPTVLVDGTKSTDWNGDLYRILEQGQQEE